jgi:hypothetical protein
MYLTSPFLYTYPGFESEKIEPWQENGEEWRRLKVTFPEYVASHTKTQITHFGPDGLMRRHDYTVDILDAPTTSPIIASSKGSRCRRSGASTHTTRTFEEYQSRCSFRSISAS